MGLLIDAFAPELLFVTSLGIVAYVGWKLAGRSKRELAEIEYALRLGPVNDSPDPLTITPKEKAESRLRVALAEVYALGAGMGALFGLTFYTPAENSAHILLLWIGVFLAIVIARQVFARWRPARP